VGVPRAPGRVAGGEERRRGAVEAWQPLAEESSWMDRSRIDWRQFRE
jgi:hypothetical protein